MTALLTTTGSRLDGTGVSSSTAELDHLFVSPALAAQVRAMSVDATAVTGGLSDHAPLVIDLELSLERTPHVWDEEAFAEEIGRRHGQAARDVIERLVNWADQKERELATATGVRIRMASTSRRASSATGPGSRSQYWKNHATSPASWPCSIGSRPRAIPSGPSLSCHPRRQRTRCHVNHRSLGSERSHGPDARCNTPLHRAATQGGHMIYVSDERQGAVVLLDGLDGATWQTSVPTPPLAVPPLPAGLALTLDGRLMVADRSGSVILIMDRDGANATRLDPGGSPVGALKNPTGVAMAADGAIYVADTGNQRIVRATSVDAPTWSAYGAAGSTAPGEFLAPSAVAVDAGGRVLVTDPAAHRLVRFDDMTGLNWTELTVGAGPVRPYGISCDSGGSLITELSTRSVLRLHPDDSVTVAVDGADELIAPIAAVMDGATIVVADAGAAQVSRWTDAAGTWKVSERLVGVPKALPGPQFTRLGGMTVS